MRRTIIWVVAAAVLFGAVIANVVYLTASGRPGWFKELVASEPSDMPWDRRVGRAVARNDEAAPWLLENLEELSSSEFMSVANWLATLASENQRPEYLEIGEAMRVREPKYGMSYAVLASVYDLSQGGDLLLRVLGDENIPEGARAQAALELKWKFDEIGRQAESPHRKLAGTACLEILQSETTCGPHLTLRAVELYAACRPEPPDEETAALLNAHLDRAERAAIEMNAPVPWLAEELEAYQPSWRRKPADDGG